MSDEEIFERLIELGIPSVLNAATEHQYIRSYLERTTNNTSIWNSVMLSFFSFEENQYKIPSTFLSPKQRAIVQLLNILFLTEGSFGGVINLIVFSLSRKQPDCYRKKFRGNPIPTFDEVLELRLSNKLEFLRKNGFGFVCDLCPKDLRNSVAHQNFLIDDNGAVHSLERGCERIYSLEQISQIAVKMGQFATKFAFKLSDMLFDEENVI